MFNITICGSLKNIENMKKLRDKIYSGLGDRYNVYVSVPNPELTMWDAQFDYVKNIANADMVLIIPKDVKWDNKLYCSEKTLHINDTADIDIYIPVGVLDFDYHDHEGIIIGESTSYEMTIAHYFNKSIQIVVDKDYTTIKEDGQND